MNEKPVIPSSNPAVPARGDAQWVMIFNLYIQQGKEQIKKTYKVNKKRLVIGSALSSDIRIQQNAISNLHAVVEIEENGKATIFDMASETGVFVNDKKIVNEDLKDGDEVKIGFATLTFKKVSVNDEQKTVAPAAIATTGTGRKLFYDAKEDFRPLILEDERNIIQIFDYPNATEQCLQVVMYWGDVILDVAHIVGNEKVTIGESSKSTFTVPGMHNELELAAPEGSMTMLSVTGDMTGVVRSGNKVVPVQDMGSNRFHLRQNDLAKLQFRDITFFVSYSAVPPHLRRQRLLERDPLYMQIWFASVGLTLAFIVLMASITIDKPLEPEEVKPEIVVKIFEPKPEPKVKPPPPPPEPKKVEPPVKPPPPPPPKVVKPPPPKKDPPKPIEKPKQIEVKTKPVPPAPVPVNQVKGETPKPVGAANKPTGAAGGNQGAGAKFQGASGAKGDPNKPKPDVHMKSSKGNPRVNTPTKSQVQGQGNVEAMFSDISGNLAKSMAASGAGARGAVDNARSYDPYTTGGAGGAGQVGTGSGGGGNSRVSEGMGDKGLGNGLTGTGLGSKGTGGTLLGTGSGGGGRPNVEVGNASETVIMGGLDKSVIDEYIKRHMRQIRGCYEKQLNSAPKLRGRIATRFVIAGSGRVSQAGVTSSEIGNATVESCLLGVLKRIEFPEPLGGGVVEVDYPFNFTPSIGG